MHYSRAAFTLVEVLLAVALGTMIILVGATGFRAVSQAMKTVNGISYQNEQLRHGWWACMRNVDWWENEASAEAPYFRLQNRHSRADSKDRVKAPFAPVVFSIEQGPDYIQDILPLTTGQTPALRPLHNPNTFLPHDPRSWYRHHLFASTTPGHIELAHKTKEKTAIASNTHGPAGISPRLMLGEYGIFAATDTSRILPGQRFQRIDWTGDREIEPEISAEEKFWEQYTHLDPSLPLDWQTIASTKSRLTWQLHQRLGPTGMSRYLPNGSFLVLADQDGDWPSSKTIPRFDHNPATYDHHEGFNSFLGRGYSSGKDGAGTQAQKSGHALNNDIFQFAVARGATDWEKLFGLDYGFTAVGLSMIPVAAPGSLSAGGEIYWKWDLLNYMPFRGNSPAGGVMNANGADRPTYTNSRSGADGHGNNQGSNSLHGNAHPYLTSTTVLVPYNLADLPRAALDTELHGALRDKGFSLSLDSGTAAQLLRAVDLDSKPDYLPVLSVGLHRIQGYSGADLTINTINVDDPNGRTLRFQFSALGTSYRGARQHWAEMHIRNGGSADDPDQDNNPPIGDFYR